MKTSWDPLPCFCKIKVCRLLIIATLLGMYSCNNEVERQVSSNHGMDRSKTYTTWSNMCFDRAASIWLITEFLDSNAIFRFQKFGTKIKDGIPFDVPGAELGRQRNICCFESIIQKYNMKDPAILKMARVIHDIDVNKWGIKVTREADSLETIFLEIRRNSKNDDEVIANSKVFFQKIYTKFSE